MTTNGSCSYSAARLSGLSAGAAAGPFGGQIPTDIPLLKLWPHSPALFIGGMMSTLGFGDVDMFSDKPNLLRCA